jgi:transcriptional regulator with PAS, ATPase and Fis domain
MEKFIATSQISQQILKSAKLSADLPINTLIYGQNGVGKKLLAHEILPNALLINGGELEKLIIAKQIDLDSYQSIIVDSIDDILNVEEFFKQLKNIKIVGTNIDRNDKFNQYFAIKIEIPPLRERPEDLDEIIEMYKKEAMSIYNTHIPVKNIEIDLSENGITLKQSIYKSILLQSINTKDMLQTMENYLTKKLENGDTYRDLIEIFEIPLLKAAKKIYKSQLQMADKLEINRITLRKKIHQYFGEL